MSVCIETKYIGPTNYKPSRIKAWTRATNGPSLTVSMSMEAISVHDMHVNAAKALATKLGWTGEWFVGDTHSGIVAVRPNGMVNAMAADFVVP
jgi:hypothetical protein